LLLEVDAIWARPRRTSENAVGEVRVLGFLGSSSKRRSKKFV
jgi:hypothetical protein